MIGSSRILVFLALQVAGSGFEDGSSTTFVADDILSVQVGMEGLSVAFVACFWYWIARPFRVLWSGVVVTIAEKWHNSR